MAKSPEKLKPDPFETAKRIMGRLVKTPPKPHKPAAATRKKTGKRPPIK